MINSLHHSRELVGLSQNFLMVLSFLHGYVHKNPHTLTFLSSHKIYSIPAVNIDGFFEIERIYNNTKKLEFIRKNMNEEQAKGKPCKGLF
jgi:hypothetical protein